MERIEDCISFLSAKAAQAVARVVRDRLSTHGVTPVQYAVLQVLWEQDGRSGAEICHRLALDSATVTGIVDRLERLGLVARHADAEDRRVSRVVLTPNGRGLRVPLQAAMDEVNADVARHLGDRAPALREMLRRLATFVPTPGEPRA